MPWKSVSCRYLITEAFFELTNVPDITKWVDILKHGVRRSKRRSSNCQLIISILSSDQGQMVYHEGNFRSMTQYWNTSRPCVIWLNRWPMNCLEIHCQEPINQKYIANCQFMTNGQLIACCSLITDLSVITIRMDK